MGAPIVLRGPRAPRFCRASEKWQPGFTTPSKVPIPSDHKSVTTNLSPETIRRGLGMCSSPSRLY
jgi:hypothetical protein